MGAKSKKQGSKEAGALRTDKRGQKGTEAKSTRNREEGQQHNKQAGTTGSNGLALEEGRGGVGPEAKQEKLRAGAREAKLEKLRKQGRGKY